MEEAHVMVRLLAEIKPTENKWMQIEKRWQGSKLG
jgi:hypothetical protein